jgi:hypothetical protein
MASSLFSFEGDPHGLSHPFQKAKLLQAFYCQPMPAGQKKRFPAKAGNLLA